MDSYALAAAGVAAFDGHLPLRHAKGLGEEFNQMCVGLAIDWRCGNADFELPVMFPDEFIGGGFGLQTAIQQQVFTLPLVPGGGSAQGIAGRSGNAIQLEQGLERLQDQQRQNGGEIHA